jgi:hypothetical protein
MAEGVGSGWPTLLAMFRSEAEKDS